MTSPIQLFNEVILGGMQDFTRAIGIVNLVMQSRPVPGAVCEFGCFDGKTAALIASLTDKEVWAYDSFDGLPEPGPNDLNEPPFQKGFAASSVEKVQQTFEFHGLRPPHIIPSEFKHLSVADLPQSISFAHLDGDLYESTKTVLNLIWPFVSSQGIVLVDDTNHPQLPGPMIALKEFAGRRKLLIRQPLGINGEPALHSFLTHP